MFNTSSSRRCLHNLAENRNDICCKKIFQYYYYICWIKHFNSIIIVYYICCLDRQLQSYKSIIISQSASVHIIAMRLWYDTWLYECYGWPFISIPRTLAARSKWNRLLRKSGVDGFILRRDSRPSAQNFDLRIVNIYINTAYCN